MRTIDRDQTLLWLSERGLLDSSGLLSFAGFVEALDFAIPPDAGRKTALSRILASFFGADHEAMLWIDEYGIWPSSEDPFLFEGFRRSLGLVGPVHEKPGHIFSGDDLQAVGSLVALVLYFSWGAVLYSPVRGLGIRISHDEFISVFVKHSDDMSDVADRLKEIS